jgi:GT2 family glycosyltransferase
LQTVALHGIVVVDNASDAQTEALLKREPALTVLRLEQNTGGSGGFAAGIERALRMGPDWIWLLDDDVVVQDTALEKLLHAPSGIDYDMEDLAVLCSAVEEGGRLAPMHRRYFDAATLRERVVPLREYRHPAIEIDIASFVGFLVRTAAVRRVGLPDARFFLAYDDTEFSLRLKRAGYKLWLLPGSRADHRRQLNARLRHGPFAEKHYYNLRNRFIVYRKFGGEAPIWRWWSPLVQSLLLLAVAGKGRPVAFKWWWKAVCDGRAEPYVLTPEPTGPAADVAPGLVEHR